MPAILTNELRVINSDIFKESLTSRPTYAFIGKRTPWPNEMVPPSPVDNTLDKYETLKDVFGLKRVLSSDLISVLPRVNWQSGIVFDHYDDTPDIINQKNPETNRPYRFYVLTDEFNVYKCLDNNYNTNSLTKPTGTQSTPFETSDGYVWKYMYTIKPTDTTAYLTINWMPCYTLKSNDGSVQWFSQNDAVPGSIEYIKITNRGSGYFSQNPPTITINGDGTGATATATVNPISGQIQRINITNAGKDYTKATVTISGSGVGAARAIISPRKGHGADPRVELGANYVMVKVVLDGDEGGELEVDTSYRITGLISMPLTKTAGMVIKVGNEESYKYSVTDSITGSTSGATSEIVFVDRINDLLYVKDISGVYIANEQTTDGSTIEGFSETNTPMTELVNDGSDFDITSGELLFISNREFIDRVNNQKEEIISVLSF